MDIELNFVNQSSDANNSKIVLFQKNVATDFQEIAIAWKIIQNIDPGYSHPFVFPTNNTISTTDSWGNYTPQLAAEPGRAYALVRTNSGDTLTFDGETVNANEIEIRNKLDSGSLNANVHKDGMLLAAKTNVAPAQKAVFAFEPTLWIGPVGQIQQGEVMDQSILSGINTELPLLGVAKADIVMSGGGGDPLAFRLENVEKAS